ncbi:MAG: hypothetical protein J7513_11085, partial [Solirubrobacteraceae bacterium]|nr:hypothetical protein [Solirubrobacteraceae bacterium]
MTSSGVHPTLQQAQDRLAQLNGELDQWVSTVKAPLRHTHDAAAGVHEWRIEAPAAIPDEITRGAGEVLTGLRAALDGSVREASAGAPQPEALGFPITTSIGEFEQLAATQLAGVPEPLRAVVESYQLYQANPTPISANLGVLARLSGLAQSGALDGQIIIAAGVDQRSIDVTASQEGTSANVTAGYSIGKPANGELALRIEVTPAEVPVQVKPFDPPSLAIAFGDDSSRVAIPDLHNLLATVARVQEELRQFAGAAPAPTAAPAGAAPATPAWPAAAAPAAA